ncbi:hypothetical protein EON64_17020, partial [archaeon]
ALGRCDSCIGGTSLGCFNGSTLKTCKEDGSGESTQPCTDEKPFCDVSGGGRCVECRTSADCKPLPDDCYDAACEAGACVKAPTAKELPAKSQLGDECNRKVCDGAGGVVTSPIATGSSCGAGGFCNGKGACGVCPPGALACATSASTHTCGIDGQWQNSIECSVDRPTCGISDCQSVVSLSSGSNHTCALLADKTVKCWGDNGSGQLGNNGAGLYSTKPVAVVGLGNVKALSSGYFNSCALTEGGEIFCWGLNVVGSLGNGADAGIHGVKAVKSQQKFKSLSSFGYHSCAIDEADDLYCWGSNSHGESGADPALSVTSTQVSTPIKILSQAAQVAVGSEHSCVLKKDKTVHCWGIFSSLGVAIEGDDTFLPVKVANLPPVDALYSGSEHVIVKTPPTVPGYVFDYWHWGRGTEGQLIDSKGQNVPVAIFEDKDIWYYSVEFYLGHNTTCVVYEGLMGCAGDNSHGQLGSGTKGGDNSGEFGVVNGAVDVAPGERHMCALQSSGKVFCWGQNSKGQLGHGDTEEHLTPIEVAW